MARNNGAKKCKAKTTKSSVAILALVPVMFREMIKREKAKGRARAEPLID